MRIFIDACDDPRVVELFADHQVLTAFDLNWNKLPDPEVVRRCAGRFDVFITADQGFEFEHNLARLSFGIVILHVTKNRVQLYRAMQDRIAKAILEIRTGQVIHVREGR